MRFDGRLLDLGYLIFSLDDKVRLFKSLLDVADINMDFGRQVAAGIGLIEIDILYLIMDLRRTLCHGLARIQDRS